MQEEVINGLIRLKQCVFTSASGLCDSFLLQFLGNSENFWLIPENMSVLFGLGFPPVFLGILLLLRWLKACYLGKDCKVALYAMKWNIC